MKAALFGRKSGAKGISYTPTLSAVSLSLVVCLVRAVLWLVLIFSSLSGSSLKGTITI